LFAAILLSPARRRHRFAALDERLNAVARRLGDRQGATSSSG
jgi:hypothetical protein